MKKYQHGGNTDKNVKYDFSANINPLGMPENVKKSLAENIEKYSYYPDPDCIELVRAISIYESIPEKNILCGNGAADLIYRIVNVVNPCNALLFAPSFSEYEKALLDRKCNIEYYYLKEEDGFSIKNFDTNLLADKDICFLCNPNNPVGNVTNIDILIKIINGCQKHNVILVIDECFMDFVLNGVDLSAKKFLFCKNLVILKAFTKIYAMAGLRLGYILSKNEMLIEKIRNSGQPWSVSVPAQLAGYAALRNTDFIKRTAEFVLKERKFLNDQLNDMKLKVFPSETNFIMFKSENFKIDELIKNDGIAIRNCENYEGLCKGFYRIAVRNHMENEYLISAMERCLKNG